MIELSALEVKKSGKTILNTRPLRIERKSKTAIFGHNGSGKTTLLKILAGLVPEYRDSIKFDGVFTDRTMVHQDPFMFRGTVRDNLKLGLAARNISREELSSRIQIWSKKLNIASFLEQNARNLSGGEKKRVALTRALILRPKLLLIDEPFSDLDHTAGTSLVDVLLELESTTVVLTTPIWDERFDSFERMMMEEICGEMSLDFIHHEGTKNAKRKNDE